MRMLSYALAGILAIVSVGLAPAQDVAASKSKWPTVPAPKLDVAPPALAVFTVKADEWFLIERDSPAIVLGSPNGLVEVVYSTNKDGCPVKYKGKFAGGDGKTEEKEIKAKFVIELKPLKSGRCEIIIVPHGVTKEVDIERKTVDVDAGEGAQPPPVVVHPPIVVPPPTQPVKGYFLTVRPDGPASQEFVKAFSDPAWQELKAEGHTVKELTLTESLQFYKPPAGTAIPFTVTIDATNKKVLAGPVPMPTTSDAIRKLREGVK